MNPGADSLVEMVPKTQRDDERARSGEPAIDDYLQMLRQTR
jgi:hypothetical protein